MIRFLPLSSSFHSQEKVREAARRTAETLKARGIPCEEAPADRANVLLVLTGGTEHLALKALETMDGPALLLAHPDQNSLPASLEILARIQQQGRQGRIVLLHEETDGLEPLQRLSTHLEVRDKLKSRRLGRIGAPSDWLVGSMPDPALVRSVWGPEIVDVSLDELRAALEAADAAEVTALQEDFRKGAWKVQEPTPADLAMAARVTVGLRSVIRAQKLDACTVRCFDLVLERATTGCLALSWLLDEGIPAGCEGDLPAALTMLWFHEMSGHAGFMANPQDLDPTENALWLAHCTIARRMLTRYALRSHYESSLGVGIQGDLHPGDYTLARIGGADLRGLFVSDAAITRHGDSEHRCRTQVQIKLQEDVRQLLTRPQGNHHVLAPGHWAQEMKDYHDLMIG